MKPLALFLFLIFFISLNGQAPFDCNYPMNVVTTGGSSLAEIFSVQETTDTVLYSNTNLPTVAYFLSAGYRITDGNVYGLGYKKGELFATDLNIIRFGNNGSTRFTLTDFADDNTIFAGEVTPDGRYLLAFDHVAGTSITVTPELIIFDLQSQDVFPSPTIYSMPTGSPKGINDFAFDSFTGNLYAYDISSEKLCILDITNKTFLAPFPANMLDLSYLSALFFDRTDNLYGLGTITGVAGKTHLFAIDKLTGKINVVKQIDKTYNANGFTCRPRVYVWQRYSQDTIPACGTVELRFTIHNYYDTALNSVILQEIIPAGLQLETIVSNPLGGQLTLQNGQLRGTGLTLPAKSENQIVLRLKAQAGFSGSFAQKAALQLNNPDCGCGVQVVSDNPATELTYFDSTRLTILNPERLFLQNELGLCEGKSLEIKPEAGGNAFAFKWNTGATTPNLTVTQPGNYIVTITGGCPEYVQRINVTLSQPSVELPQELSVFSGAPYNFQPNVKATAPIIYTWNASKSATLSCLDCVNPILQAFDTATVQLQIADKFGCVASNATKIFVKRSLYIPNAFSPNDDGVNDYFQLYGDITLKVKSFVILDRWGNQLFFREGCQLGDEDCRWNGRWKSDYVVQGLYLYHIVLENPDGSVARYVGEVSVVK